VTLTAAFCEGKKELEEKMLPANRMHGHGHGHGRLQPSAGQASSPGAARPGQEENRRWGTWINAPHHLPEMKMLPPAKDWLFSGTVLKKVIASKSAGTVPW
jgi:hypothetical protein